MTIHVSYEELKLTNDEPKIVEASKMMCDWRCHLQEKYEWNFTTFENIIMTKHYLKHY